jgi:signal transduction histidine kinase
MMVNGKITLVFKDNGLGMNMAKVKDRLFGLYQRFHQNNDGQGLGLYLTKSQITSVGGTIDVDSTEDVGTTFTIVFK